MGTEQGITGIYPANTNITENENSVTAWAARELREYLVHIRTEFSFPLSLRGTPFQLDVWNALRQIPYGHTVSYSEIAQAIGRPTAVRAVAQAIGKNPCLIAVPCHRVLGKDGSLTGFSAGLPWKKYLLSLEGKP